jgi:hypothetical protein
VRVVISDLFAVHRLEMLEHLSSREFVVAAFAEESPPFSVSLQMLFLVRYLVKGLATSSNWTYERLLSCVCS